jgi:hypothetical protein
MAPTRACELQSHDGNQQHPHEGVDGQKRLEPQQGRSLDREQEQQHARDDGRQLLVAGAPTHEQSPDADHVTHRIRRG